MNEEGFLVQVNNKTVIILPGPTTRYLTLLLVPVTSDITLSLLLVTCLRIPVHHLLFLLRKLFLLLETVNCTLITFSPNVSVLFLSSRVSDSYTS